MKFFPDNIYHIHNKGNNQQLIFRTDEDYLIFLKMLREQVHKHVEVLVYTDERSCIATQQLPYPID